MSGRTAPAVSIILNALDGEAHLHAALQSVLAQDFDDWELILWDDRSTDGTAELFRSYPDERFRYFLAPVRTPLGRARIDAVAEARGEWLAFLDQDDVWTPDKLGAQMALARSGGVSRPLGMVYGRAVHLHPSGRTSVHDHRHEFKPLPEGDIFPALFADSCFIAMSAALVHAEALRTVGGVPPEYDYAIDYEMYLALAHRFDVRALQTVCCLYRVHHASLSSTRRAEVCREALRIFDSWSGAVDSRTLARPRRAYQTLLGLEEARAGRVAAGFGRILRRGSLVYLGSRPFAWLWRAVRRRLRPSPWPPPRQTV